ncbi:MAG: hypothetical protein J5808_03095 [Paludibacteraceae bacterium]|nr:hypothetical protein [Paludibacteraceae bacterium]
MDHSDKNTLLFDKQGNPLNPDGSLKIEIVENIDQITDEDFNNPYRSVQLPTLPENVDVAIAANGRPVIIKKNVFEKNREGHKEISSSVSRMILTEALYSPNLYGQSRPISNPWYRILVKEQNKTNAVIVLDVYQCKQNVEIVGWRKIDGKGLERMKRQSAREDGQLLILSPDTSRVGGSPFRSSEN